MNLRIHHAPGWAWPLLAAILFGSAGWWAGRRARPPGEPAATAFLNAARESMPTPGGIRGGEQTNATDPAAGASAARRQVPDADWDRMIAENERLRDHLDQVLGWIVDNLGGRFPVPEPMLAHLRPPALAGDFSLHPEVVDLLRIRTDEREQIDQALLGAARLFHQTEAQAARAEWHSPAEASLYLPGDPATGALLRADVRAAFDAALGADRAVRLWTVAETGLNEAFQSFGDEDRTIVFSLVPLPDDLPPLLRIRDTRNRPGAGDEPARETALEWLDTAPPDTFARYVQLLMQTTEGDPGP